MNEEIQYSLEREYLGLLCIYPERLEDFQDPRWFTDLNHLDLLAALKDCWDGKIINVARMQTHHPASVSWYSGYLELDWYGAEYDHLRYELEQAAITREIVRDAERLGKKEITFEQFKTTLDSYQSCQIEIGNGLPDDMVAAITSDSSILRFEKFRISMGQKLRISENTVTTIAAYTSRGKSALALNLANDLRKEYPIVYFNLEMNQVALSRRLMAINTGIPIRIFQGMHPTSKEQMLMKEAEMSLKEGEFRIVHGSRSAESVRAIVNTLKNRLGKPPVVFVDHVNYLTGDKRLLERERIGESMKILNALAKDGKATVFVLAQINREGEKNASLSKLQGSSAIEQDSDNVLILEPEEDEIDGYGRSKNDLNMVLKAQKVRDGVKGNLPLLFRKDRQQFIERL